MVFQQPASRVYQTLTATLQPNTLYTLSVYVGYNKISVAGERYYVSLGAGSGTYPTVLAYDSNSIPIAKGNFELITLQYLSPNESLLLGERLQIWLANDSGNVQYHVYFDDVTLTANSAVPLPGAVWFLGSGLLGLAGLRRFRKR